MSTNTVLHIAPTPFFADRGCHIRIEGIVNCLADLGYDNLVCTYHHGREVAHVDTSRISRIKNYTKTEAGPSKYKLWADWKLLWLTVREIQRTKPTVIHAHLHEGLMIGLIARALFFWKDISLVADMQGSLVGELETHGSFETKAWLRWPVKAIEASLMFFAKTIVCSSRHSLEKLKTEFNLNDAKVSLVQDGANMTESLPAEERIKLRSELGLPIDKRVIVYSGALLASKGLNELKQLISLLGNKANFHFLIVGYPVDDLEDYLQQHKLTEFCTLTGQVEFEKLPSLLKLADIAVDPKMSDAGEGSGKMLNYLACALPVIAFNNLNNQEFLPAGMTLANSIDEMAQLIENVLQDKTKIHEIGASNLAHFKQHYSWDKTKAQLQVVYQNR